MLLVRVLFAEVVASDVEVNGIDSVDSCAVDFRFHPLFAGDGITSLV
jgi:hypothetical protein